MRGGGQYVQGTFEPITSERPPHDKVVAHFKRIDNYTIREIIIKEWTNL